MHITPATRENDERHSSQRGTRLALVSNRSQMRHPEGKNTLTSASLISASQTRPRPVPARTPVRRSADTPLDELPSAMHQELYSFLPFN
jgi:hypothetical protein